MEVFDWLSGFQGANTFVDCFGGDRGSGVNLVDPGISIPAPKPPPIDPGDYSAWANQYSFSGDAGSPFGYWDAAWSEAGLCAEPDAPAPEMTEEERQARIRYLEREAQERDKQALGFGALALVLGPTPPGAAAASGAFINQAIAIRYRSEALELQENNQ